MVLYWTSFAPAALVCTVFMTFGVLTGQADANTITETHSCFITTDKQLYCSGRNSDALLGGHDDDEGLQLGIPVKIPTRVGASQVALAERAGCFVSTGSKLYCWGNEAFMPFRKRSLKNYPKPVRSKLIRDDVVKVVAGLHHFCALTDDAVLKCWGNSALAHHDLNNRVTFRSIPDSYLIKDVAAGAHHTCFLNDAGKVYCFGRAEENQINGLAAGKSQQYWNDGDVRLIKQRGLPPGKALALGRYHSCMLATNKRVYCWGDNADRQSAQRSAAAIVKPTLVQGLKNVKAIAAGDYHTCALTAGNEMVCWGANSRGQLGVRNQVRKGTFRSVVSSEKNTAIYAGGSSSCYITAKKLRCFGENSYGQLPGVTYKRHFLPKSSYSKFSIRKSSPLKPSFLEDSI